MDKHPSEHRRAWDAIPWVVAGAASAEDQRVVLEHLQHCEECLAEWALQQRVRDHLVASPPPTEPDIGPAWQRMQARLDSTESMQTLTAPNGRPATASDPSGRWTRWLVAAVVVQAVGLGAMGLAWVDRSRSDASAGEYLTLSQPSQAHPAVAVRLVPAPAMDFGALRGLLAATGLVVVEFSPDGRTLGLAAGDGNRRTAAQALPLLRAAPGVLMAEPMALPQ
jgi:Putative zinc-finger